LILNRYSAFVRPGWKTIAGGIAIVALIAASFFVFMDQPKTTTATVTQTLTYTTTSPTTLTTTLWQTTQEPGSVSTSVTTTELVSTQTETQSIVSTVTSTTTTTSLSMTTSTTTTTVTGPVTVRTQVRTITSTTSPTTTSSTTTTTSTTATGLQPTRTADWWMRHVDFLSTTWNEFVSLNHGGVTICGVQVGTAPEVMGAFWASRNQTSTGAHRGVLASREMALAQNYLAGILNVQAFGTNDHGLIQGAWNACQTVDPAAISSASLVLAAWDMSGNKVPTSYDVGPRDSASGIAFANIPYWDSIAG